MSFALIRRTESSKNTSEARKKAENVLMVVRETFKSAASVWAGLSCSGVDRVAT